MDVPLFTSRAIFFILSSDKITLHSPKGEGGYLFHLFSNDAYNLIVPTPIHTIAIYRRLHTDNICAIFLLKEFGEEFFPGVKNANVEFWDKVPDEKNADDFEKEGYLLVDMGDGKFDHHEEGHTQKTECASTLIAKFLKIDEQPALKKLLTFVKRDDLEGRGIVSKDIIDRMFGLPALILNLAKTYPDSPEYVVDIVIRIFQAHYYEQYRRTVLMPMELEQLKNEGKISIEDISAGNEKLRVVFVESDSDTLAGFLRAYQEVSADIVVIRRSSGHINIITKDRKPRVNFRETIALLRMNESQKKGATIKVDKETLEKPGRLDEVPEWYYDTAANSLQNGGAAMNIEATKLDLADVKDILYKTLPNSLPTIIRTVPMHGNQ